MKDLHQQVTFSQELKLEKSVPAKPKRNQFLNSLYDALEKSQYKDAMCWDFEGRAFILKDSTFIAERILKEEFCGMKLPSFIRQLSYYGFKRISRRSAMKVYSHEQFRRDRRDFLKQIKRNQRDSETIKANSTSNMHENFEPEISNDIVDLMERRISFLQAEIEKMRAENLTLRSYVQTWSKKMRNEKNSYENLEIKNRQQTPNSNGFSQTFFSPQAQVNDYHQFLETVQGNRAPLSMQHNFMEVYQPDCRCSQVQAPERNLTEIPSTLHRDTPLLEESDISHLFNYDNQENFENEYWRNEEPLRYKF